MRVWLPALLVALSLPAATRAASEKAEDLLGAHAGLLVAADLLSGAVLYRVDRRTRPGAVPAGSLLKPFLLLAWATAHPQRSPPRAHCAPGGPPGCWYRPGHGLVDVERGLAVSCNAYFRRLSREVDAGHFDRVLAGFGLHPWRGSTVQDFPEIETRLGRGSALRFPPQHLLEAYGALWTGTRFRLDPLRPAYRGAPEIAARPARWLRRGLAASGREGTARAAGQALPGVAMLAKTGTTARLGEGGGPLDTGTAAWFVGAVPGERPELGVLVYLEEGTGSRDAAPLGGRLLRRVWGARSGRSPKIRSAPRR